MGCNRSAELCVLDQSKTERLDCVGTCEAGAKGGAARKINL